MVKKEQKVKSTSAKPTTSVKKGRPKTKKEKLTNGHVADSESKRTENQVGMKTEEETNKSSKENASHEIGDAAAEIPGNVENTAEQEVPVEADIKADLETPTIARKRKAPATVVNKNQPSKTTSKRRRVLLEIPKISTITGKVFVVGSNDVGQLALAEDVDEQARPTPLDLPSGIIDIAAGGMHSVCLTENGKVITFGCNDEGALGRVTPEESLQFIPHEVEIPERIVQISAGDSHSAALSESGQVYIWGNFRNNNGSMGLLAEGRRESTPVRTLNGIIIVKISSGSEHLACLSQEGVVYTCGVGEQGQLGRISEHASANGGRKGITLLLEPAKVPVTNSIKTSTANNIWTSLYATFIKTKENGLIYACGLNNCTQLGCENPDSEDGDPKPIFRPRQIASFNGRTWLEIKGDSHHTLSLDDNGLVYALGRPEYGRLGLGENSGVKSEPTRISSLQDKKCITVSCGGCASFAVTENGSVFSWGMASYKLGHEDDENDHFLPKLIEGDLADSWKVIKVSGGGQHTLILVQKR